MEDKEKKIYDSETIYCRRLGHYLKFAYCRSERQNLPCAGIFRCWSERIPVTEYLDVHFNQDELQYLNEPAVPKLTSIIELIQKAQSLHE